MSVLTTTRLSSKGQVVIPEKIREEMHLETGTEFVILGQKDVLILKTVVPPSLKEWDGLIRQARKTAKEAGLKPDDLQKAIRNVRRKRRV